MTALTIWRPRDPRWRLKLEQEEAGKPQPIDHEVKDLIPSHDRGIQSRGRPPVT